LAWLACGLAQDAELKKQLWLVRWSQLAWLEGGSEWLEPFWIPTNHLLGA